MHELRLATADDLPSLAAMMGVAFQDDPVSISLWPNANERANRQPKFFGVWLELAHRYGSVITSADRRGAALWFDINDGPSAHSEETTERLFVACGPRAAASFFVLDHYMSVVHPRERHTHLAFVAALPGGTGLGTALLRRKLEELDLFGVPAYLEASSPRNAALYEQVGFEGLAPITVPGGATFYPMRRKPAPAARDGDGRP